MSSSFSPDPDVVIHFVHKTAAVYLINVNVNACVNDLSWSILIKRGYCGAVDDMVSKREIKQTLVSMCFGNLHLNP